MELEKNFDELLNEYNGKQLLTSKSQLLEIFDNLNEFLDIHTEYNEYNDDHEYKLLEGLKLLEYNFLSLNTETDIEKKNKNLKKNLEFFKSDIIDNKYKLETLVSNLITIYETKSTFITDNFSNISESLVILEEKIDELQLLKKIIKDKLKAILKKTEEESENDYNERIEKELIERIGKEIVVIDDFIGGIILKKKEKEKDIDYEVKLYLKNIKYPKCMFNISKYIETIYKLRRLYLKKNIIAQNIISDLMIEYSLHQLKLVSIKEGGNIKKKNFIKTLKKYKNFKKI